MNQRYATLPSSLFINNRKRFVSKMQKEALAIFHSNDEMPRNGDCFFPFRQNSDFFHLSGIDQEQSVLVLCPNHPYKEILFVRESDEHTIVWEGKKYSKEEATKVSGIANVFWTKEYDAVITALIEEHGTIYLNANENERARKEVISRDERMAIALKHEFHRKKYERSAPIMQELREIKSKEEVDIIQSACNVTDKAFRRVLCFMKPGVWEYEVEAEISHEFIRNKSVHAYTPIIASGANACVLHYVNNNQKCKKGDLVLMDFGAEYANYASDLTRTIPVSGKFTKRQKDVYNAVLRIMKESTKLLVAGNTLPEYNKEVRGLIERELLKLKLITKSDITREDPKNPAFRKYFMHGISHFMGLDVHDLGNKKQPFQDGMIFTCEPGIYIPEEKLGIRIENDILITAKGPKDLMKKIPVEVEEIEELMNG
ncbi:MAG: aminopeptidase P family protein [Flavobacteriales bacterium]